MERACGRDVELRQDVESLLACEANAARFIETPALDVAVALLTDASHAELVGQTIGPYVIEAWLGSGGMGDVYRVRDRQLHRDVALKVLPRRVRRGSGSTRALHTRSPRPRCAQSPEYRLYLRFRRIRRRAGTWHWSSSTVRRSRIG